jgi:hypothetical protein
MNGFDDGDARAMILSLLSNRAADATVCPSEVARALTGGNAGEEWRKAMPIIHAAAECLLRTGAVRLSWKGAHLETRSGPYRIAVGGDARGER